MKQIKVKTAKGRKLSSTRWLARQLNDPYIRQAKAQGYLSRAAFKLIEIDDKYKFLKPKSLVVDLGAAPGGWCQVAAKRVQSDFKNIKVIGIDILPMAEIAGTKILQCDFLQQNTIDKIMAELNGKKPDVILSDLAAATIGHKKTDHLRTMNLTQAALDFALQVLAPNGSFLAKSFKGGTQGELLEQLKQNFKYVRHIKPPASRPDSVELYMLAQNRK